MTESFLVAVNAVIPFFFYMALGAIARALGAVDEAFLNRLNKFVFAAMFPFMTFNNIYTAGRDGTPSLKLVLFSVFSVLLLIALLLLIVPRLEKKNSRRGVIIQAVFRSNFVIFGVPLTVSVFGPGKASVVAIMVAVVPSLYNVASVIILELFDDEGDPSKRTSIGSLLLKLAQNPLLQGCAVGLVFFLLKIRLPDCLAKPIASLSDMTSPLAMIVLGGTLQFKALRKNLRILISALTAKLVLIPLLMVPAAYALGLRGVELFLVLVIFGAPVAAASYPMAASMGGDGELAGQLVFTSTVASLVTLFAWIFCMNQIGLLI